MRSIIRTMSVDVFGRQLEKNAGASDRGPPGIGFKVTADGNYDIDNKRLCNVLDPVNQNDAATLNVVQSLVHSEIHTVYQVTTALRGDIDDANVMIETLGFNVGEDLKNLRIDIEVERDLVRRSAKLIAELNDRLTTLENEREKAEARDGTA